MTNPKPTPDSTPLGGVLDALPRLSLRDYLAGQALVGALQVAAARINAMAMSPAFRDFAELDAEVKSATLGLPEDAYKMADLMLAAREAKPAKSDESNFTTAPTEPPPPAGPMVGAERAALEGEKP